MSFEKLKEFIYYEMIYQTNEKNQKIILERYENNLIYEMIYKPNENKKEKKEKKKEFKEDDEFIFDDEKEYNDDVLRIFGKYFVKHNKNKCKIIYKNKKYELKEYFEEIDNNYNKNYEIIKLKLIGINNISDISEMFYGCIHLTSILEYPKENNIIEPNNINPLNNPGTSLSEEKKSNIINKTDNNNNLCLIEDSYETNIYNNDLIKELDDLSLSNFTISINNDSSNSFNTIENIINYFQNTNLKVGKLINTSCLFSGCISLMSVPDISKWNISNVVYMNAMFYNCSSLISFPDLSK